MNFKSYYYNENGNSYSHFLLTEGGSYGHIFHLYEDKSLSKNNLKQIFNDIANNKIELKEKFDGVQLSFSFKDNNFIYARNKSHVKNKGEQALSKEELLFNYNDRRDIEDIFKFGIEQIENEYKNKTNIFQNGKKFIATEIVDKNFVNVIPYNKSDVKYISIFEYDNNGNIISEKDISSKDNIKVNIDKDIIDNSIKRLDDEEDLEKIVAEFEIDILANSSGYQNGNNQEFINKIKDKLNNKIKELENSTDNKVIEKFNNYKSKLESVDGFENIFPYEGVVFKWRGQEYKLTGTYSYVNRIINLILQSYD